MDYRIEISSIGCRLWHFDKPVDGISDPFYNPRDGINFFDTSHSGKIVPGIPALVPLDYYGCKTAIRITTYQLAKAHKCEFCEEVKPDVIIRRRNSAYHYDWMNFTAACEACAENDDAQFQEMWDDYNSSRL